MGLKLVLVFTCLAYVSCRTFTVQKTSLSLTEESEDTDELSDILQTFLGYPDVISGLQSGDVEGCAKGKCTFCTNVMKLKACFVATLGKNSITIEVTLNKKPVVKKDVKVPNPPAVCKKTIPHVPFVKDVCVQIKNIDLKKASGCVYISLTVKKIKKTVKIGCFKIPRDDAENDENGDATLEIEDSDVESIDLQDGTLKFEPFSNNS